MFHPITSLVSLVGKIVQTTSFVSRPCINVMVPLPLHAQTCPHGGGLLWPRVFWPILFCALANCTLAKSVAKSTASLDSCAKPPSPGPFSSPRPRTSLRRTAQNFVFFPSLATMFFLYSLSWWSSRGILVVGPSNVYV